MNTSAQSLKVQKIVAAVSVVLFLIKFAAWYITHSVAILTDALESIVNVVAGIMGVYSLTVSARPRDADHPYGHGKVEFISAAVEGTLILTAALYIMYESVKGLSTPSQIHQLDYGLILIASTALINWIAGTICLRTGKRNHSLALMASGKHLRSDTYTTLGILIGLVLLYFTGYAWIDKVVAIIFAGVIGVTGYKILRTSVAGIMDETDQQLMDMMIRMLQENRNENWIDLHNLRIIKYGPMLHVDCHLTVPWYFNVHEAHVEVDKLGSLVKENFGESVELFVHSDGCLDFSCAICSKGDCPVRKHPFEKTIEWNFINISNNTKHHVGTSST
ncbi:MAG TPA: cation diffusion facilitator family transporter [Ferruginibacter sp.]|nr:cation diffusion facilitator family transporter [Ferruginibacter sp.]HRN90974.1 cation diffusion facilitator family transporter [Ferruginibacter sp.]HRO05279.1 cation diffusion facilitator family transporter [Ferruginibacter sp.]HRO96042.1 cation diffusion facilitator family transporter [Ferruginibacter sp.]HRP48625.1 cation diffusion facilitator family transporter [Ferruginibacter sp.]